MSGSKSGTKINIGLRSIYNFHVGNELHHRVNMSVIKEWYPENTVQQEYYILKRIRELADGKDGHKVYLKTYENIASLYMTYITPSYTTPDGKTRYSRKQEYLTESVQRARERFEDMKRRGLVSGDAASPSITFSGIQKLDSVVTDNNYKVIADSLCELKDVLICSNEISEAQLSVLNKIVDSTTEKITVSDCMEKVNNAVDFVGNTVKIANGVNKAIPTIMLMIKALKDILL